ncbi:MAG: MBL fold metallo-hydrolase, partial [Planctomycetota bacterium]
APGAAAHALDTRERATLTHVLVSHAHLDHTLGLPFLVTQRRLEIVGLRPALDAVRESLFDGRIWPDLTEHADWRELRGDETLSIGDWTIEAGPADHTLPCVSYFCVAGEHRVAVLGDTRRTETVLAWTADRRPTHCIVECSFPDAMAEDSRRWGHQTPLDLPAWRAAVGPDCRLLVTHVKPMQESRVRAECEALQDPALTLLQDGDVVVG